mmetsp:Transcript_69133/g.175705  ORF Transcript_69133/g.175705 Transcript_69133/m.175705 type:complete len:275 (+) Transcript_69133:1202-2026(+)
MSATSRTSWLRARRSHFLSLSAALRKRRCSIVMQSRLFGTVVPLLLGGAPTSESSWLSSSSWELQELDELLLQLLPESSLQSEPALQLRPPGKEKRPASRPRAESGPRADPREESTWKLLQPVLTGDFPPAEHNAFLAAAPLKAAATATAAASDTAAAAPNMSALSAEVELPSAQASPASLEATLPRSLPTGKTNGKAKGLGAASFTMGGLCTKCACLTMRGVTNSARGVPASCDAGCGTSFTSGPSGMLVRCCIGGVGNGEATGLPLLDASST